MIDFRFLEPAPETAAPARPAEPAPETAAQQEEAKEKSIQQIKTFESFSSLLYNRLEKGEKLGDTLQINNIETLENTIIEFDGKYIYIKDKYFNYTYSSLSLGNKKLESNENIQFILFNIINKLTCNNATDCIKYCYNNRGNASFRNTILSRIRNTIFSSFSNFSNIMIDILNTMEKMYSKKILFRWHESGDIYNTDYRKKIVKISNTCKNITFLVYTKDLLTLHNRNEFNSNTIFRFSIDSSTPAETQTYIINNHINTFIVTDKELFNEIQEKQNNVICDLSKCTNCLKCYTNKNKNIFIKKR